MIEQIIIYLISIILGIMLFFSFVIAPVVFTTLNEENARKFIRRIFPFYYNVNLGISLIVLLLFSSRNLFINGISIKFETANKIATAKIKKKSNLKLPKNINKNTTIKLNPRFTL